MLKKIALGGVVLVAAALSLSIATATTPTKIDKNAARPYAPIPQGICLPPYGRC